jgi:hypothetical protein
MLGGAMGMLVLDLAAHPLRTMLATADLALRQATLTAQMAIPWMGGDPDPLGHLLESHLVWARWWHERLDESALEGDMRDRARLALDNALDAVAPSSRAARYTA